MQFRLGRLQTDIAGGPYRDKPLMYEGVKMAAEIPAECLISIPTRDFDVPDEQVFKQGLQRAVMAIDLGLPLYVGCMGGIGRTGLFLAGMAKIMTEYRKKMHRPQFDPILYVRQQYIPHAVETKQQVEFIEELDVSGIVNWWYLTQRMLAGTHKFEASPDCPDGVDLVDSEWPVGAPIRGMEGKVTGKEPGSFEDAPLIDFPGVGTIPDPAFCHGTETGRLDLDKPNIEEVERFDPLGTDARLERIEDIVLELDRRLKAQEAARTAVLKELATARRKKRSWGDRMFGSW